MKTVTRTYQTYKFNELSDNAKNQAISDHINFLLEVTPYEEMTGNFKKAVDKAEAMQTPWFTGSYVFEYCKDEIVEEILLNEYDFNADGTMFTK